MTLSPQHAETLLNAAALLNDARAAQRQARLHEALVLCRRVLTLPGLSEVLRNDAYHVFIDTLEDLNLYEDGLTLTQHWMSIARQPNHKIDALLAHGRILSRRGENAEALTHIAEGQRQAAEQGYRPGLAAARRFQADILWARGDTEQALVLLEQTLPLYASLRDHQGQIRTLISKGIIEHLLGQFYAAIQTYMRAATLCEVSDDRQRLGIVYNNMGESYQQLYAMEQALKYHEKARDVSQSEDPDLIRNLGIDLVALGRIDEGLAHLREALDKSRQSHGDQDVLLQAIHSLAEALYTTGDLSAARILAQELLERAQLDGSGRHISRASLLLGYCARADQDSAAAQQYFQESFMTAQRSADKLILWQTHAAMADLLADTDAAVAAVHHTIASDLIRSIAHSIEDRGLREIFKAAPVVAHILQFAALDDDL